LFPASLISLTFDDSTRPARRAPMPSRAPDSVLDRVAQGDASAQRECIDRFGGLVWSIARRVTRTRAEAEEVVQEIFVDLWRTAGRFDPEQGSEEVFVTMVARRRLIDRMRRATQQGRPRSNNDVGSLGWANAGATVDSCPEALAARQAVMRLRPELRKVLELGLLQGLSHAEIAKALQLPLETVEAMMRRGLIQTRELMGR
jgi:RNA polymerase sigma-70 factor (ECF subfamily)